MLSFDWNVLRPGDSVLVHGAGGSDMTLAPGVVVTVNVRKGSNGVGIRVTTGGQYGGIVWPSRLAVHLDPRDPAEPCWRCQALCDAGENQDDSGVWRSYASSSTRNFVT